jgi:hypothetical protein
MLARLRSLLKPLLAGAPPAPRTEPPLPWSIALEGTSALDLRPLLDAERGFVRMDWAGVRAWVEACAEPQRGPAWALAERAWLAHLREDLGPDYRVDCQGQAVLLSALPPALVRVTLDYMVRSQQRIGRVLEGLASFSEVEQDILIVFEDDESYYRYAGAHHEEGSEMPRSSGMYLARDCGHFIVVRADLRQVEPVIVHEMTHASVGHLQLPTWVDEGLAVNTEERLSPPPGPGPLSPAQMNALHRAHWQPQNVQDFWSGRAWQLAGDANMLAYDLARILVAQFSQPWERFCAFAQAADFGDGGAAAAREHLGIDLGVAVCAVLEQAPSPAWAPAPSTWAERALRGGPGRQMPLGLRVGP